MEYFEKFSGLRINPKKCSVLKMGPFKDTDTKYYTLKQLYWSPGPVKILGVQMHTNPQLVYEYNFEPLLHKAEDILKDWRNRQLTIIGKITVLNTLVSTLFIHKFMALPTPPREFFGKYKELVLSFLWNNKKPKIPYNKLIQAYDKNGLN